MPDTIEAAERLDVDVDVLAGHSVLRESLRFGDISVPGSN
jgi:hypothetical protein